MSIKGFGALDEYKSYLKTAIVADGFSDAFKSYVVERAIKAVQDLDEELFLKEACKIANRANSLQRKPFRVVFPIWSGQNLLKRRRKWGKVWINFEEKKKSSFNVRARNDRAEQVKKRRQGTVLERNDFSNLPLAVCSVRAINIYDAFELAENAISKELGILSLLTARGQSVTAALPNKTPVNVVLFAPHMTVHNENGKLAHDTFWFNEWSARTRQRSFVGSDIDAINANADFVREKLRKLPWRFQAEQALARHYQAFSQCDLEASFLDGWRLLEMIGGVRFEKGETLVSRAASFFDEHVLQQQIGEHLRYRRNLISHGQPVVARDDEGLAFQMREFLNPMLLAYLTNPFKLKNLEEFWQFCDLPADRSLRRQEIYAANRRVAILRCGAEFRKETV